MKFSRWPLLLPTLVCIGCGVTPVATLKPSSFPVTGVTTSSYKEGQQIGNGSIFTVQRLAKHPVWIIEGQWIPDNKHGTQKALWWSVEVHSNTSEKQKRSITTAVNGYEAELGWTMNASMRICPRFERKKFSWGKAVSFLAQYQNDNTNYVPNNGMLQYEVHGITHSDHYIRARFRVTHPQLQYFGEKTRHYPEGDPADPQSPMNRDPHYQLVESCTPESFSPSLAAIDQFLDSLQTKEQ